MVLASLTNRIFLAAAALVVLVVGFTAAFVNARITAEAERELRAGLVDAGAVVDRQSRALSETFLLLARLIADLPKLKAAVTTGDPPTVAPLAAEYGRMLRDASFVVVSDPSGRVLASVGTDPLPAEALAALPSVAASRGGAEAMSFHPHPSGILQVLSVPITLGQEPTVLAGSLSLGFLLDGRRAAEFKALTGSDIGFGLGNTVHVATLPQDQWSSLSGARRSQGVTHVNIGDDDYIVLARPLAGGPEASPSEAPFVAVGRSRTERLRVLGTIRAAIAAAVVVAMLLATVLSYAVARTVTRPLAAITTVMRDVSATGDLTLKIPERRSAWEDEDAHLLAKTFNTLTDSIARFEKEAAQRERLSSLGRLASVIAHEIRNPLMIIKAASRVLRQPESSDVARVEAVQDIEGEIIRLNRIVSDVLDYARPITFHWQRTDVNDVCRESAAAVRADDTDSHIEADLAREPVPIVSDPDRLRVALVNLLTNARHAVAARRAQASTGADSAVPVEEGGSGPVRLHTEARPGGGARISVSDRGTGIDPILLPRVFEPFFTTRQGGTGLGLAIVRNIVDGLGGSIAVINEPAGGTSVCIDLPAGPANRQPAGHTPVH